MTKNAEYRDIKITPGVMPSTDATASDVPCWVDALHVRFDPATGRLRKLGGWDSTSFDYGTTIDGTARTLYSAVINQKVYTVIGTNTALYGLVGSRLTNITPLDTTGIAAADSLATHYATLANDPITTIDGSNYITIADTEAALFQVNDNYTLSGAATVNGIPDTDINATHVVRSIGVNTITIRVATAATSSGAGGGASVVRSSGLITLTSAAHGLDDGERVAIDGAATFGGIADTDINQEFIIRNVTNNTFDFMTEGTANASASAGGGAATEYFPQIADGNLNGGLAQGYGAGLYGVGLYGTALTSTLGATLPRIWFCDRFADNIILTPGNQTGVYSWDGDTSIAPALLSGAPSAVNYVFVSDNIVVTFGAGNVENKIFASDQGNPTQWVSSSNNQVFEDNIEGAARFISHVPVDGYNLIFTEQQTYTFKYIGLPLVWDIELLDSAIGLIAPMARVSVNGIAYWMGQDNFYMFRGGKVEIIPSNISTQSSCLRYVFDDLNYSQRSKIFAWYNEAYDEIWWHYPSANSNECDRVIRFSRRLLCWWPDMMNRTAAEYPTQNLSNPRLMNVGTLYTHEGTPNDDGAPLAWSARTKKFVSGKDTVVQTQFVPDFNMTGNITLTHRTYNYPQSQTAMNENDYTVTPTMERVPVQLNGRYWDYELSGEALNQTFLMGNCFEEPQRGATAP